MSKWKKPASFDTNMVVIGAGSAGLVTSYIAALVKARVTLVEKQKMGRRLFEYRLRTQQGSAACSASVSHPVYSGR